MVRLNSACITFRLDQPCGAVYYDLTIEPAIACITTAADHLEISPLEAFEQQLLEGE